MSADGKTVTVKLRDGVHFSPPVKREVTSADVKYAIERGFFGSVNNPYAPAYFGDVVGAKLGAEAGHDDLRHLRRRTRARSSSSSAPPDRRHAGRRARPAAHGPGAARVRAAAGQGEGLGVRRQAGRDRPVHGRSYKPGKNITLVRNPSWNAKTDFRPAYLDRIEMPQGNDDPIDRLPSRFWAARTWPPATT